MKDAFKIFSLMTVIYESTMIETNKLNNFINKQYIFFVQSSI